MNKETILFYTQSLIIVLLVSYIIFNKPNERVQTEYETVIKEKIVEVKSQPKIIYKCEDNQSKDVNKTRIVKKDEEYIIAMTSDSRNNYTIALVTKINPNKILEYKRVNINGIFEEIGYESGFNFQANKILLKKSLFKLYNKTTKETYYSSSCFDNIDESEMLDVTLDIVGQNLFCTANRPYLPEPKVYKSLTTSNINKQNISNNTTEPKSTFEINVTKILEMHPSFNPTSF